MRLRCHGAGISTFRRLRCSGSAPVADMPVMLAATQFITAVSKQRFSRDGASQPWHATVHDGKTSRILRGARGYFASPRVVDRRKICPGVAGW